MTVIAPFSKYKKGNFKIGLVICVLCAAWFTYDGHFNEKFKEKHTNEDGTPDSSLAFNQKSPAYFAGAAVLFAVGLFFLKDKKIVAEENELILANQKKIPYDSIEKIDRTNFDSKGYFVVTYKDQSGTEVDLKISDRKFDNLQAVLDLLVAKIS